MKPNFDIENTFWDKGYIVVGVDEVGRGAVAGPVVACAAALKPKLLKPLKLLNIGIDDSKRLTRKQRDELEPVIKKYFYWGMGEVSVGEIDKLGIVKATRRAMKRACQKLKHLGGQANFKLLIDGRRVRGIGNQEAIVKGDQKSVTIAAASIIAKVYRDNLMRDLSGKYKGYGFERHVGYGTKYHAKMIKELGMCIEHREVFVRSLIKQ